MTVRVIRVALLLASLPIAGCGTVANLARTRVEEGGTSPFGGVRQDVACLQKSASGEVGFGANPNSGAAHYPQTALTLFCVADLPLSLIGDLVTWPYTVVYTFINQPIPTPAVVLASPPVTQGATTPPVTPPMPIPIAPVKPAIAEGRQKTSP